MAGASLLLARIVGPTAFAPIALLLVVNSLAVQVSDLGLGFAVLRSRPGDLIANGSLLRLRRLSVSLALGGAVLGLVLGGSTGAIVAAGAWVWASRPRRTFARLRRCGSAHLPRSPWPRSSGRLWSPCRWLRSGGSTSRSSGSPWRSSEARCRDSVRPHWRPLLRTRSGARPFRRRVVGSGPQLRGGERRLPGCRSGPDTGAVLDLRARVSDGLRPARALANPITNTAFVELADASPTQWSGARGRVLRRARAVRDRRRCVGSPAGAAATRHPRTELGGHRLVGRGAGASGPVSLVAGYRSGERDHARPCPQAGQMGVDPTGGGRGSQPWWER